MHRIIGHWTGGSHKASSLDKKHYHFIYEGDGKEVKGAFPVIANAAPKKGGYAAHTLNCNTGSIGLSMACMAGATERNFGRYPMTESQFEAMAEKAASLCIEWGIEVTPKTVLSHAEVQTNLGIKQRGKWDFTVLPFRSDLKGAKQCGDYFRKRVQHYIAVKTAPPMASLPALSPEAESLIADADKHPMESTTTLAASVGGLAGAGGLAADLLGVIADWRVQALLIVLVAAAAFWIIRERMRKADMARVARARS